MRQRGGVVSREALVPEDGGCGPPPVVAKRVRFWSLRRFLCRWLGCGRNLNLTIRLDKTDLEESIERVLTGMERRGVR